MFFVTSLRDSQNRELGHWQARDTYCISLRNVGPFRPHPNDSDVNPLTSGEFGGTMITLVSASESVDCGNTGALRHRPALPTLYVRKPECRSSLGEKPTAEEAGRMLLGALRDPEPVAPSGLRYLNLWSISAARSLDEALDEVTGWCRAGSDRDMQALPACCSAGKATSEIRRTLWMVDWSNIPSASSRFRLRFILERASNL